jgi:hypothetical protein
MEWESWRGFPALCRSKNGLLLLASMKAGAPNGVGYFGIKKRLLADEPGAVVSRMMTQIVHATASATWALDSPETMLRSMSSTSKSSSSIPLRQP